MNAVIDGIREYCAIVLLNEDINNCKVTPSLKVQLNKNNISELHFSQELMDQ